MKSGWEIKKLGELCEVVNGGTPKTNILEYWGGKNLWITPAEMGKRSTPYVEDTERKITDAGLANSSARILPKNSVILSSRAPIGHLIINSHPMATNQECKGLIPKKHIDCKFLYYYLFSIVDILDSLGTGATFKELSGGKLKEVFIPHPDISIQRRIVAILDEAFAGIAAAKEKAELNLKNAKGVFTSCLESVFSQRGEGWNEMTLKEISSSFGRGKSKHRPRNDQKLYGGKYPSIQTGDIRNANHIITDYSQTYNENGLAQSKLWPKGTICITIAANIAETAILNFDACFPDSVIGIVVNQKKADSDYVEFLLRSLGSNTPLLAA
jgi:type I restriction enzyme S subunit